MVQRLEEHVGGQDDCQGVTDVDGAGGQAYQGQTGGHGDEEEREQAVGEQDDELVARQQPHDGASVRLPLQAQARTGALRGPGQGEGAQSLDRVEVLGGQAHPRPSGVRRRGPQPRVAPGDEGRDHDDGRRQDQGGNDVDEGGQLDEHQQGSRRGRQCGGQEGLPVEGHPLCAVGQQGGGRTAADVGGACRAQPQQVSQGEAAQVRLLGERTETGDPLGHQLAGGAHGGRGQGLGEQARRRRGAQQGAQGASGADEAPPGSQGAQERQTEGEGACATPGR